MMKDANVALPWIRPIAVCLLRTGCSPVAANATEAKASDLTSLWPLEVDAPLGHSVSIVYPAPCKNKVNGDDRRSDDTVGQGVIFRTRQHFILYEAYRYDNFKNQNRQPFKSFADQTVGTRNGRFTPVWSSRESASGKSNFGP